MTPERWGQVKAVVADALEMPAEQRAAYVDRVCAGDDELRAEVESLLAASDGDSLPDARAAVATAAADVLGLRHRHLSLDPALHTILESALGQQYEILRPLGHGGMGAVYLARDRALERFVAIKVLRPDIAVLQDGRERFRREARIVAQLSHPGILSLHTFGEVRGLWYFVTGYVPGPSLAERLRVEGRLESDEAHRILAEVADALAYAHQHGVIHRDIKPANILLDQETGRAVLADFGIAKVEGAPDELTSTGIVIGTPSYMSPEQAAGDAPTDARSDIYSLGAVGYVMLAGGEPFAGPTLEQIPQAVPRELAQVVVRALARNPALRWPTAESLRDALARARASTADSVPESLRGLSSFGPYALLWALAWTTLGVTLRAPADGALLFLVALLVPIGFMLHLWNVGGHGFSTAELARVAFWPPEWWGMWWPRALRRKRDLWHRLPWPARAIRVVMSIFCIALPSLVLLRTPLGKGLGVDSPVDEARWFNGLEMALIGGAAVALAGALAWARYRSLEWGDAVRVLFGATTPSPAWADAHVARLLAPADDRVRAPDIDSPADHRRAISELAALLPENAVSLRVEAPALARRLLAAIDECRAEAASLTHDASDAELDRLRAQVSALESEPAGDSVERQELLALVRRQLELVHGMRMRAELVTQRCARLLGLMRGLWSQVRLASAVPAEESSLLADAIARARTLSSEIDVELGRREDV